MTILYNKYQNQKSQDQMTHMTAEGKDRVCIFLVFLLISVCILIIYSVNLFFQQIQFLREQAEVITSFAGNIPFRMPGDVYSQLTQMQILMH